MLNKIKTWIAITLFIFFTAILFSMTANIAKAQAIATPIFTPTPTQTPNPTVVSLQNVAATQQIEIQTLQRDIQSLQGDLRYEVRDIKWWFIVAVVVAAIIGIRGYNAINDIDNIIRRKIQVSINKNYYQLDIMNLKIHVPDNLYAHIVELLDNQGLQNHTRYAQLDKRCYYGITIVSINDEKDEEDFVNFIKRNNKQLKPSKAGFVLYLPIYYRAGGGRPYFIKQDTIDSFSNIAVANTPWMLLMTITTVGRSVSAPLPPEDGDA